MKKIISLLMVLIMTLGMTVPAFSAEAKATASDFTDIGTNDWFTEHVLYVFNEGLMLGTGQDGDKFIFEPEGTATRSMIAMIFWRMSDSPEPSKPSGFTDVPEGLWYSEPIAWMKEVGLGAGKGNNFYGAEDAVTREELATFFYRYARFKTLDLGEPSDLSEFQDADKIQSWALPAMKALVGAGIINGKGEGIIDPSGTATRAEIATMLHRFNEIIAQPHIHEYTETITKEPTCTEPGIKTFTCSCGDTYTEEIPPLGHDWGEPAYEWSTDKKTCTAKRVCKRDDSHIETAEASVTVKTTIQATCTEPGEMTYTAEFNADWADKQVRICVIPALGHEWSKVIYTWSEDYAVCTASRICKRDNEHIETADSVSVAKDETPATCERTGKIVYTAKFNVNWAEDQKATIDNIPALGHDWGEPTYEWNADNKTCTAKRVCKRDPSHMEICKGSISTKMVSEPTCTTAGEESCIATFSEPWAKTQTVNIKVPALGHEWGAPTYEWSKDNTHCTAVRTCKHQGCNYKNSETVESTQKVIPATNKEPEYTIYTATFKSKWATTQTKKCATGDSVQWGKPEYQWNNDNTKCTAIRTSINYPDIAPEKVEAKISHHTTLEATCEKNGTETYVAEFNVDWATTQTTTKVIPALGHDWDNPNYEWNEDNTACIATRICKRDPSHVETAKANITTVKVADPTCEESGSYLITAAFDVKWAENQTVETKTLPLGHDWGDPTYEWNEDFTECVATRTCKRNSEHKEYAHATISSETIIKATCKQQGKVAYTAKFKESWASTQTKTVDTPKTDHDWEWTQIPGKGHWETRINCHCGWSATTSEAHAHGMTLGAYHNEHKKPFHNDNDHSYDEDKVWVLDTPNTDVWKCNTCSKEVTDHDPRIENCQHEFEKTIFYPNCQHGGYTHYRCKYCGYSYDDDFVPKADHVWITKDFKAATCMEDGYRYQECEVCGKTQKETIPKHPHDWKEIPLDDPNYDPDDPMVYRCAECGAETDEYPFYPLYMNCEHEYTTTIVKPTTTKRGYTLYKCSKCGFEFRTDFVPPLGQESIDNTDTKNMSVFHLMDYILPTETLSDYLKSYFMVIENM